MTPSLTQPALHQQAADHCSFLADQTAPDSTPGLRVWWAFAQLARLIEVLPPTVADLGTICYLRNRCRSSADLLRRGERGTAHYQLREMARKLSSLGGEQFTNPGG